MLSHILVRVFKNYGRVRGGRRGGEGVGIVGMGVMVYPRDLRCVLLCTFYGSVLTLNGLPFVPKTRYMYMFSRFCPFTWLFQNV